MSGITVMDLNGKRMGTLEFPESLLVYDKGDQAVQDVIVAYQAGLRAGTASTKGKGAVAGSNKKPWQQKGLGRARAGYRQSPVWRGGAVAFGPHPRSYAKKVNKKTLALAFRRALSDKVAAQAIMVVDTLDVPTLKTKAFSAILRKLNVTGSTLIVIEKINKNVMLAAQNIPKIEVALAKDVNTFQLVRYARVIAEQSAMAVLENRVKRSAGKE